VAIAIAVALTLGAGRLAGGWIDVVVMRRRRYPAAFPYLTLDHRRWCRRSGGRLNTTIAVGHLGAPHATRWCARGAARARIRVRAGRPRVGASAAAC